MKIIIFFVFMFLYFGQINSMFSNFFGEQAKGISYKEVKQNLDQLLDKGLFSDFLDTVYQNIENDKVNCSEFLQYLSLKGKEHPIALYCSTKYKSPRYLKENIDSVKLEILLQEISCLFAMIFCDIITSVKMNLCSVDQGFNVYSMFQKEYSYLFENIKKDLFEKKEGCFFTGQENLIQFIEKEQYNIIQKQPRYYWTSFFKGWKSIFSYGLDIENFKNIENTSFNNIFQKCLNNKKIKNQANLVGKAAYKIILYVFSLITWSEMFDANIFSKEFIQNCISKIESDFNFETKEFSNPKTIDILVKSLPIFINKNNYNDDDNWEILESLPNF